MKTIALSIFAFALIFAVNASNPSQQYLINKRVMELKDLNDALLKNSNILEKYPNQDVYVKARLIERGDHKYELILKEVSTSPIDDSDRWNTPIIPEKTDDFIYLQGKVIESSKTDTNFKFDIENVLPPSKKP